MLRRTPPAASQRAPVDQRDEHKGSKLPQIQNIEVRRIGIKIRGWVQFTYQDLITLAFKTEDAAQQFFQKASQDRRLTELVSLRWNFFQVELKPRTDLFIINHLFEILKDFYRDDDQPEEVFHINTLLGKYSIG